MDNTITIQYNKEKALNNMIHSDTETTVAVIDDDTIKEVIDKKEISTIITSEQPQVKQPERAVLMQCSSSSLSSSSDLKRVSAARITTIKRQPSSMSNIDLFMHEKIPPRILPRDASFSFIWIDDHFSDPGEYDFQQQQQQKQQQQQLATSSSSSINKLTTTSHDLFLLTSTTTKEKTLSNKLPKPSIRAFCNLFTIIFIISIILFLFLYPFITLYFIPVSSTTTK